MGRPRVLMLGWEFPPRIAGGLGVACAGLVPELRKRVDLELLLPSEWAEDPYGTTGSYSGDVLDRVWDFAGEVRDESGDCDLIHAHDWLTVPAASELCRQTGLPLVLHLHSLEVDRSGLRNRFFLIERAGMRMAEAVMTVSEYTADLCEEIYGIPRSKIHVVPNGVEAPPQWSSRKRSPKVVFIGRMTAQKSPGDFLSMAARVSERMPEAEFVMAGVGDLLDDLKDQAAQIGVEGRVRFPGFLTRRQVTAELATAAVLCLPSRSEPFGLVALEAAASGVPSVLTENCGVRQVLPSATVLPVGDVDGMANAVEALLGDEVRREALGRQAREEAGEATWELAASRVLEVYREVLG